MKFKEFRLIYIDTDYLRELYNADSQVFYAPNHDYWKKPFLGLLIAVNGSKYVIPLTSAKEKHMMWSDVTTYNYRIYEIIDTRKDKIREHDIITDIKNTELIKNVPKCDRAFYKQKILSVLEIRKMIPVIEGIYRYADLDITSDLNYKDKQQRILLRKEYFFLRKFKGEIERRANEVYEKQITTGKVLKYHCNFKRLEETAKNYEATTIDK